MYKYKETKTALRDWEKIKSMSNVVKSRYKNLILDILADPQNLDTFENPEKLKPKRLKFVHLYSCLGWEKVLYL